jgi:hypothetical protein
MRSVLLGHYNYYGRQSNFAGLVQFYEAALGIWRTWLGRRSNDIVPWQKMKKILIKYPLPKPRITQGKLGSRSQTCCSVSSVEEPYALQCTYGSVRGLGE